MDHQSSYPLAAASPSLSPLPIFQKYENLSVCMDSVDDLSIKEQGIPIVEEEIYVIDAANAFSSAGGAAKSPDHNGKDVKWDYLENYAERINVEKGKDYLKNERGWPDALAATCLKAAEMFPIRFFICDNSASMSIFDGHKLMVTEDPRDSCCWNIWDTVCGDTMLQGDPCLTKFVQCSRWAELKETLKFHVELSHHANCPSEFRFLNSFPPIRVTGEDNEGRDAIMEFLDEFPRDKSPLHKHISDIIKEIDEIKDILHKKNQIACITIFTDGKSSDGDLINIIRLLKEKELPVWVVIRLCTDDEDIVSYWNNIQLGCELNMDILDDLKGEAEEVYLLNPWITYGQPLHHLREFGIFGVCNDDRSFHLLDKKKICLVKKMLGNHEQRDNKQIDDKNNINTMRTLFESVVSGAKIEALEINSNPEKDFKDLLELISNIQKDDDRIWDPISQKMRLPVRKSILKSTFHSGCWCSLS